MPEIIPEVVFQKAEHKVVNAAGEKQLRRTFEIVDGRQRIQTLVDFMAGKFPWVTKQPKATEPAPKTSPAKKSKTESKLKKATTTSRYWKDLSPAEQECIWQFEFRARILVGWPGDKVSDAFRAINSGKPLTAAQVLNAGCSGGVKVLRELPEAKEFIEWLPKVGFPSPRDNAQSCFLILCRIAVIFVLPSRYTLLTATDKLHTEFSSLEMTEEEKLILSTGLSRIRTAFTSECAINNVPELLSIAFCFNALGFESWPAWPGLGETSLKTETEAFKEFGKFYSEEVIKHRMTDARTLGPKRKWIREYYCSILSPGASSTLQRRALTKMAIEKQGKLLRKEFVDYLKGKFALAPAATQKFILKRKGVVTNADASKGIYYPPSKEASHEPKRARSGKEKRSVL